MNRRTTVGAGVVAVVVLGLAVYWFVGRSSSPTTINRPAVTTTDTRGTVAGGGVATPPTRSGAQAAGLDDQRPELDSQDTGAVATQSTKTQQPARRGQKKARKRSRGQRDGQQSQDQDDDVKEKRPPTQRI